MNSVMVKYVMLAGVAWLLVGAAFYFFGDKLTWLGRLPGYIRIDRKDGGGFYVPVVSCLVLSLLLNLIIVLIRRFFG